MIAGVFHEGSGLGNQLHRYVMTRVLAADKGYDFTMMGKANFKGFSFMNIDMGADGEYNLVPWMEKKVVENGVDIRSYDPEINFVEDNTVIDGEFQDERYFKHRLAKIDGWLKVEPCYTLDQVCVIGFRGGEYTLFPELFLQREYWETAIAEMRKRGVTHFEVHTDDSVTAQQFFPNFMVVVNKQISHSRHTNMGLNWRAMRYAKHAIIANSSFYILPRLLKHFEDPTTVTIAPRYWARRYAKVWAQPQNYYSDFTYV